MGTGLVSAGALAALMSGCGPGSTSAADGTSGGLEGAWREEIKLDDGQLHQALILWESDQLTPTQLRKDGRGQAIL